MWFCVTNPTEIHGKDISMAKPKPTNKKLYDSKVAAARKKFDVWPSAYASAWVVKEYKKAGGKYSGSSKNKVA